MKNEIRPNFIIPGAGRSGTTALASYLDQRPEIFICKPKEPNFFSKYYHLGIDWYVSLFKDTREFSRFSLLRYLTKKLTGNEKAFGDASTTYFLDPKVPKRIYKFNPDMKFIFMLRDPAERAYSSYKYAVQYTGLEQSFEEIIYLNDIDEIQKYFDVKSSFYYTNISRFLDYFPKEQMIFIIFEEFIHNPESELRRICKFLGVNESFKFDMSKVNKNASKPPLSLKLQKLIYKIDQSIRYDDNLIKFAILSEIKKIGNKINHLPSRKRFPPLTSELREHLYREYFEEEIRNLEKLLGREIRLWH